MTQVSDVNSACSTKPPGARSSGLRVERVRYTAVHGHSEFCSASHTKRVPPPSTEELRILRAHSLHLAEAGKTTFPFESLPRRPSPERHSFSPQAEIPVGNNTATLGLSQGTVSEVSGTGFKFLNPVRCYK